MNPRKFILGKTYASQNEGGSDQLNPLRGHKLLCSDGVVRAAVLDKGEPKSYFELPATIKIKGETITGIMEYQEALELKHFTRLGEAYVFIHDEKHSDKLPKWPEEGTKEHSDLICSAGLVAGSNKNNKNKKKVEVKKEKKVKHQDWFGYQVMIDGKEKLVKDLTDYEAKDELCKLIEFVEDVYSKSNELKTMLDDWRQGKI